MSIPVSGEIVEPEERIRGYEIAKGEYIPVEDSELDAVALESTHTIDIESFVPRTGIDEVYFDKSYYLAPDDKVAEEPFAVIREAMRNRSGMVGLARVVLFNRERILMIEPRDRGLVGTTLHYAYEVRDDKTYFEDIPDLKIAPDMLELATHIINTKKAKFDPSRFEAPLPGCRRRTDPGQARRAARTGAADVAPQQCRQPDGRVAAQRRRRQGCSVFGKEAAPARSKSRPQACVTRSRQEPQQRYGAEIAPQGRLSGFWPERASKPPSG